MEWNEVGRRNHNALHIVKAHISFWNLHFDHVGACAYMKMFFAAKVAAVVTLTLLPRWSVSFIYKSTLMFYRQQRTQITEMPKFLFRTLARCLFQPYNCCCLFTSLTTTESVIPSGKLREASLWILEALLGSLQDRSLHNSWELCLQLTETRQTAQEQLNPYIPLRGPLTMQAANVEFSNTKK